ncbi:DUF2345 domain-containing protein, partial [uncultured Gilliamella sp.]|uniref:DUF2345 domain-containing protein n=1 Tax=uncultured Gilliamella sp. TaxID=1193505 RepID=UPI0025F91BE9
NIDSVDGKLTITASKELTLICGGSYIKISSKGIELGTPDNVKLKCNVMQKMGPASINPILSYSFIKADEDSGYSLQFLITNDDSEPYENTDYLAFMPDGTIKQGITDKEGYTEIFDTTEQKEIIIHLIAKG